MRLTIDTIKITNFKGIRDLTITLNGKSAAISGMNGIGKTTVVDAFHWLLFNTDSHGNAPGSDAFREKPLDENGNIIHNLDTVVEVNAQLDGQRFDLKRVQSENWVKKRGSIDATFQGNVSKYFINGLEQKVSEFRERINNIADADVFRLVGSLSTFNSMDWKKRRQQLLNLAGNDVDDQLLQRDEYRQLADEVGNRNVSVDDLRKILTDQRKNINNELKMLPVRIDEAKKSIPQLKPNEAKDAEYLINDSQKDIEKIDKMILDEKAKAGNSNQGAILARESELISVRRRLLDEHDAGRRRLQNDVDNANEAFRRNSTALGDVKRSLEKAKDEYNQTVKKRDDLRAEFTEVKHQPIEFDQNCPTCGQPLPDERIQEIRTNLEGEKRKKLDTIKATGKEISAIISEFETKISELEADVSSLEGKVSNASKEREKAFEALKSYPKEPDWQSDERIKALENEIQSLKSEQTESPDVKVRQFEDRKAELLAIIDKNRAILTQRDIAKETEKRVKEYEKRQQDLGTQLSETEILIYQVEKFVTDRCGALEDSINSHFPTIRWKLFDSLINGAVTDCCEAMIQCESGLVPISSCNTAAAINGSIEIVGVLSDYYNVHIPLFIDSGESVNSIKDIDTQTIVLRVGLEPELKVTLKD